ncbi:DUF5704 domain-containing protein [Paenibacillus sp. Y412MC10]|uniref:DUF5704 domain-containing protein n=1 Tax=Geobacillus sp. (strain Y412MC10) TaxID=481743 RepID=UPI0011AB6F90|nr:DUF5704 domain-containing protein [Paenibacillus sp. Y412MC10]
MIKRTQRASFNLFMSLVVFTGGIIGVIGNKNTAEAATDPYGPKSMTIDQTIKSEPVSANPGTYWYQLDNGDFRADYSGGTAQVHNAGTDYDPYPADTYTIPDSIDLSKYPATNWEPYNGWTIAASAVEAKKLTKVEWILGPSYQAIGNPKIISDTVATLSTRTGGSHTPSEGPKEFDKRLHTNYPKVSVMYLTPVKVTWEGTIHESKEIDVNPDSTIKVGENKQLNASVRTKNWGQSNWTDYVSVRDRPETKWFVSDPSIATISATGEVTGVKKGTVTVRAIWNNGTYTLSDTATIKVQEEGGGEDPGNPGNPSGSGSCTWTINPPSQSSTMQGGVTDPAATGVIKADNRGSEQFDVLKGIPTSESLYTNAFGYNYLYKQLWAQMRGTITYNCQVDVTYVLQWTQSVPPTCVKGVCTPNPPKPMSESQSKTYTFTLTPRNYSYWQINSLEVYKLNNATMKNYALPGGTVTMNPAGYTPPTLTSQHDESASSHVTPSETTAISFTPPVVVGGLDSKPTPPDDTGTLKGMAESGTQDPKVKNDTVTFNGSTVMNGAEATKDGPTPTNIPKPTTIGQNVLYSSGNVISNSLTNKADTPSTGTITYGMITGNVGGPTLPTSYPINGINTVTVHTPVVIYASITDDRAHNQKTVPAAGRDATILDRPFTVYMPTDGQHRNILGYGNRDYAKYVRDKQVYFPFDVYSGDKKTFYPKGTWISIPVNQTATTFFMPVWVAEGFYDVLFRTIAVNAPANFTTESQANLNLANHVATDVVPVDVIGRLYDFHITDISDFNWETYFRKAKGSSVPTGNSFWVGDKDIDGASRPAAFNSILPVRQGSNTIQGMQNVSVKSGYKFSFDLKTKGNMFNDQDGIRITPTFYFVNKDGTGRKLVDLYYHSDSSNFVKVGSAADVERNNVILNSRLRNVPGQDLVDTSSTLWELFSGPRGWSVTKQNYMDKYIKGTQKATYVGGYNVQILTAPLRTFKGNMKGLPSGVNIYRANAAVQQWYGEYSIPPAVYVVPQGTNLAQYGGRLDDKSKVFLKNGYVVVNFTIETIKNGNTANPFLQYIRRPGSPYYGSFDNQWRDMEGFKPSFTTPYGVTFASTDGDVIYYHADKSSYDDFNSSGTH